MDLELTGKRAIVTGGSRGIGKVIAEVLLAEGVDVAILARGREQLDATARSLSSQFNRTVLPLVADTSKRSEVDAAIETAINTLGGVDILINSAALPGGSSKASSLAELEDEHLLYDVNVKVAGYLRTARALAPHLIKKGWGRIINIGGLAAYSTGRPIATLRNVGVSALTKNLADELGPKGINVVALHPGATRTERTDTATEQRAAKSTSIGRIVDAREVAYVVAFLASPKSVAINGDSIATGGGTLGTVRY
jgi:NAD(P)-dependent dehydrogenase (short-subunit alcohol dehydrogenase family)